MSPNKFLRHILVVPEDQATKDIALGFKELLKAKNPQCSRDLKIEAICGGGGKVISTFKKDYFGDWALNKQRCIVLLLDKDENDREFTKKLNDLEQFLRQKAEDYFDCKSRLYVLSCKDEPEALRRLWYPQRTSFGNIGRSLADACLNDARDVWMHDHLKHNIDEINRFVESGWIELLKKAA